MSDWDDDDVDDFLQDRADAAALALETQHLQDQQAALEATWERNGRIHDAIIALCYKARTDNRTAIGGRPLRVDVVGENNVLINDAWYVIDMRAEMHDDEWRWVGVTYAPITAGSLDRSETMPLSDVETIKVFR